VTDLLICDPPSALRDVLAQRLAAVPEVGRVEVVDEVRDLTQALQASPVDLVLLSSRPASARAPAVVRTIRRLSPGTQVLLLTLGTDPNDVAAGMAAGAAGYIARDAVVAEAAAALALLPHAEPPMIWRKAEGDNSATDGPDLTDREWQVLWAMSCGRSNSEIGEQLFLSADTVKTHAQRLFRKLGAKDRAHAVAQGFRQGLLD
jgi:DNA-binding NarL/FixJ family response regulator